MHFCVCDFRGTDASGARDQLCYDKAKAVVQSYKVHQVSEVSTMPFTTISYYFDRASEVGLVSKFVLSVINHDLI